MPTCLICDHEITDQTDSSEHLIPESIGGRRQVKKLLHQNCNGIAGSTWDAELAKQLHPLSVLFRISRQRGKTAPLRVETTANEHLTLAADGSMITSRPVFRKHQFDNGSISYEIKARTLEEARSILDGLNRKHPEVDVNSIMSRVQIQETYAEGHVNHEISLGGPMAGRSIIKSCVAIAFASGMDWRKCNHAVKYIRDRNEIGCFGFYHERDLLSKREAGMPVHCVAVQADPVSGLIFGYAEYYGIHRVVACLGEHYSGPAIKMAYAVDPRDGAEQSVDVDLQFSYEDVGEIYDFKRTSADAIQAAGAAVVGPALHRQHDLEQRRVLSQALDRAMDECGLKPGEVITAEHWAFIANFVAKAVTPLLLRRLRPFQPPRS